MINGWKDPEWRRYWGVDYDDEYDPFQGDTNYEEEDYEDCD